MTSRYSRAALTSLLLCRLSTAEAALIDRGNGLIYDSGQNITWLQDANYAQTSGYASATSGKMNWVDANNWASNLSFAGFSDWRLPHLTDLGALGCAAASFNGGDCGWNSSLASSELAQLWFGDLANPAYYDTQGNFQPSWSQQAINSGPFFNVQAFHKNRNEVYWFDVVDQSAPLQYAWAFEVNAGYQWSTTQGNLFYAWAVRDGDVSQVPVPSAIWMFGSMLLGIAAQWRAGKIARMPV